MKGAILFTDIKSSSILWRKFPEEMYKGLKTHDRRIKKAVEDNDGMIVKSIGDSFMAYFGNALDAVNAALKILKAKPIQVGTMIMHLRMGIASGNLKQRSYELQGCDLVDYFGHTVNVAARLESNVSDLDGFAISFLDTKEGNMPDIIALAIKKAKGFKIKEVVYKDRCPRSKSLKILGAECRKADELKGVGEIRAYLVGP